MDNSRIQEFNVLGHRIKFKPQYGANHNSQDGNANQGEGLQQPPANQVVELIQATAERLSARDSQIAPSQLAVLVALELAYENLAKELRFNELFQQMQARASHALSLIEEVVPTTPLS